MKTTLKLTAIIFLFSFIAVGCGGEKNTDKDDMMQEEHMDGTDHNDDMMGDDDHDDNMMGDDDHDDNMMEDNDDAEVEGEEMEAYQCPMKCEGDKTYSEAGPCPKCGMDMKEMEDDDDDAE